MSIERKNPCENCIILRKFPFGLLTDEEIALAIVCESNRAYFPEEEHRCTGILDWIDLAEQFLLTKEKIREN